MYPYIKMNECKIEPRYQEFYVNISKFKWFHVYIYMVKTTEMLYIMYEWMKYFTEQAVSKK
jgi:hypothetical protein